MKYVSAVVSRRGGLTFLGFSSGWLALSVACCLATMHVCLADEASYQEAISRAKIAAQNDNLADALIAYTDAIHAVPTADTPSTALLQMIADQGMPRALTNQQIRHISTTSDLFETKTVDAGVSLIELNGTPGHSVDTLEDPQNQWPFPALVAAYTQNADESKSVLVCSVHFQTTDDRELAERVGRLLVLLRSVLIRRTGQVPEYENAFSVWLSRSPSASPGGEQWRNNIYLYDIGDGRSSIEWIREIAHEYGHLAIPPLGGNYSDPEAWANGFVGERLLVRWLNDPALAGLPTVESVWGKTFSGFPNFKVKLIDPPVALFTSTGLDRAMLARKDETGMRYVIGMLLWIDANKGGKALGNALWNMDSPDPINLYAVARALGVPKGVVKKTGSLRAER